MPHEISLSFRAESDAGRIAAITQAVEPYEFAALSVWDDLGDPPPWRLLQPLAEVPGNARVGPACLALPKYAALDGIASELTALSLRRPHRVSLGLAAGAWMDQIGLRPATRKQLRESHDVIGALMAGDTAGYEGAHYRIARGFRLAQPAVDRPSLLLGAWQPRMLALGGAIADEVKVGGSANPLLARAMRSHIESGARETGRAQMPGLVFGAVTVVDTDRDAARRAARKRAAIYIPVIGRGDDTAVRDFPDVLDELVKLVTRGDIDGAAARIPDELLDRFAFAGTPRDVIAQAEALFEAGVTRVDLGSPHGLDESSGIDLIGREVLPYFR